jgi:hypothetical protein
LAEQLSDISTSDDNDRMPVLAQFSIRLLANV